MKFFQFSLKHFVILIGLFCALLVLWRWNFGPSKEERLAQRLSEAVSRRDLQAAEQAIHQGAEVNTWNDQLLLTAIENKDVPMIEYLLKRDAHPQSAALTAFTSGDVRLVEPFIANDAFPDWYQIHELVRQGDLRTLKLLLPHLDKVPEPIVRVPYLEESGVAASVSSRERLLCYTVTDPNARRPELIELLLQELPTTSVRALDIVDWQGDAGAIQQFRDRGFRYALPEMIATRRVDEVRAYLATHPRAVFEEQLFNPYLRANLPVLALSLALGYHEISHVLLDAGATTEGPSQCRDELILNAIRKPNIDILRKIFGRSSWYDMQDFAKRLEQPISYEQRYISPIAELLEFSVGEVDCLKFLLDAGVPLGQGSVNELQPAILGLSKCNPQEYPRQIEIINILATADASRQTNSRSSDIIDELCKGHYGCSLKELLQSPTLPKRRSNP